MRNPELQKQQHLTLPPWEQWYLMLLHDGRLPKTDPNKPLFALTSHLLADAKDKVPRLRFETPESLRNFLTDADRIGIACEKKRTSWANGWFFATLKESREAWEQIWGPVAWDNKKAEEWTTILD